MQQHLTTVDHDRTSSAFPRRRLLAALAAAAILGIAGLALLDAHSRSAERVSGAPADPVAQASAPMLPSLAPASPKWTYYLVSSQEQADRLQAQLEGGSVQAQASSTQATPWQIVAISDPTGQSVFEDDINACIAGPGCQAGALVIVPPEP